MTVLGDEAKARVAASAMLMLPGMPFVYYGEEIGMVGAKPDETIRTPMQWTAAPNGGFTTGTPWEPLQADWKTKNVAAQDSSRQSLLNHYRRLIQLRNANPALNRGLLTLLDTQDTTGTIVTWIRSWGDEAFLMVVNFGSRESEAYMAKLPWQLLPHARDYPDYRLEPAYADPDTACAGYIYFNGNLVNGASNDRAGGSFFVKKVKAHGFCALRIRSRQTPFSH
jgi:glycosidase